MHNTFRIRFGFSRSDNRKSRIQNRKLAGSVVLVVTLLVCVGKAEAQQPVKVPRIGYVSAGGDPHTPGPSIKAFRQGLRDLGYIEGKNMLVEYRYAEGKLDSISGLVAELVQLNVDVLIVGVLTAFRAAKQATRTIPIVMVTNLDPVATGLVDSLARPGGNITGLTGLARELGGKRLELLGKGFRGYRTSEFFGMLARKSRLLVLKSMRLRRAFLRYNCNP